MLCNIRRMGVSGEQMNMSRHIHFEPFLTPSGGAAEIRRNVARDGLLPTYIQRHPTYGLTYTAGYIWPASTDTPGTGSATISMRRTPFRPLAPGRLV